MEKVAKKISQKLKQVNKNKKKDSQKVLVLGGGIAGLTAAWRLAEEGYTVEVLEREDEVGGLSRTIEYKKFFFDFSAHRFNSDVRDIVNRFKKLIGKRLLVVKKKSLIFHWGTYLEYPPKAVEVLKAMPFNLIIVSGFEFALATIKSLFVKPNTTSFTGWTRARFGKTLSLHLNEKYAKKLWKQSPETLSGDWASQRIGTFKIKDFLLALISNNKYKKVYKASDPDSDVFLYPDNGIGYFPKQLAKQVQKLGGTVKTKSIVNKIKKTKDGYEVSYITKNGPKTSKAPILISTIPLDILLSSFAFKKPVSVTKAIKSLTYLTVVMVNLLINRTKVTDVSWIYYPDDKIIFNYIMEFKNWSKKMAPKNKTALNINITSKVGDSIWKMSDKDLIDRTIKDLEKVDVIKKEEVFDAFVYKLPYAYPVYDLKYKKNMEHIRSFIDSLPHFYLAGRTGNFRYINSDQAMEEGIKTAETIIKNTHNA